MDINIELLTNWKTQQYVEGKEITKTKYDSNRTWYFTSYWTRNFCTNLDKIIYKIKSIKSPGVIHSIRTGKHAKFIMCNIRNMNTCKKLHEDYFNDTTIYINLDEKQFSERCNRISCKKNDGYGNPWFNITRSHCT